MRAHWNTFCSGGGVTTAPIPWRVIGAGFPTATLSPRVKTLGDVDGGVDVCLKLRNVTVVACTPERSLMASTTDVTALVAHLRRVRGRNVLNGYARFRSLVLSTILKTGERPRVQAWVHVFAIVKPFTDVREVFHNDDGVLKLLSVFDDLTRHLLNDVGEGVLEVRETFVNTPAGVTFLETLQSRVHLLTETFGTTSFVTPKSGSCRRTTVEGTARYQRSFSDIKPDRSTVIGFVVGGRNVKLDGDVEFPRGSVSLESELSGFNTTLNESAPEFALFGVGSERYPESVTTVRDAPTELVCSIFGMVERGTSVGISDRMSVPEFVGFIHKVWDIVLQGIFGIGREVILGNDVVDSGLRGGTGQESLLESFAVGGEGVAELSLLVRSRFNERGLEGLSCRGHVQDLSVLTRHRHEGDVDRSPSHTLSPRLAFPRQALLQPSYTKMYGTMYNKSYANECSGSVGSKKKRGVDALPPTLTTPAFEDGVSALVI